MAGWQISDIMEIKMLKRVLKPQNKPAGPKAAKPVKTDVPPNRNATVAKFSRSSVTARRKPT